MTQVLIIHRGKRQ